MDKEKLILSPLGHTWLIDLDGTVLKHNGYRTDGQDTFLDGAKEFLGSIPSGDTVIFLTSRTEEYLESTEKFLRENGVAFRCVIGGLPYGERVLMNDGKPSGLMTAVSVVSERDKFAFPDIVVDPNL